MSNTIDISKDVYNVRKLVVSFLYERLLGESPSMDILEYYVKSETPLEFIYSEIRMLKKANDEFSGGPLPLSLFIIAKDEEDAIVGCIDSMRGFAKDILVLDTGSTDKTVQLAKDRGARVYSIAFNDFAEILTLGAHLSFQPTVMWLDCDERLIRQDKLKKYVMDIVEGKYSAVAFPRSRWADWEMTKQVEKSQFPDLQVRLIKRDPKLIYRRAAPHNEFHGAAVEHFPIEELPEVAHFCDLFPEKRRIRRLQNFRIAKSTHLRFFLAECCKQEDLQCDRHDYLGDSTSCERCAFFTKIYHEFVGYKGEPELTWENARAIFKDLGVEEGVWDRWQKKYEEV
jgi:glycosyltransferase involved in cell wall biosynthesis